MDECAHCVNKVLVPVDRRMFHLFNRHFYTSERSRPAIAVSPDGGRGSYDRAVTTVTEETTAWLAEQSGMGFNR